MTIKRAAIKRLFIFLCAIESGTFRFDYVYFWFCRLYEDVFQDTMLVLVEKLRKDNFQLTASLKTYIMAIAKNIWFKRLRNTYKEVEFTELHSNKFLQDINLAIEQEKNYWDKLQNYMHQITEHCKGLIHNIFFKHKAIEQIQKEYGYTTKHNAQNQKHKCVEQIKRVKEQDEKNKPKIYKHLS